MFEERISRQKGGVRKITKYIRIHHKIPSLSENMWKEIFPTELIITVPLPFLVERD